VELVSFLKYLIESFHSLAVQKDIELKFTSEVSTLETDIDPEKIQNIISNLLANAIKFTPEEGRIHISLQVFDDRWLCEVRDDGLGISEKDQAHIFDRFFQARTEVVGTGIGLSLTRELVHLLGGKIEVESREGEGSTFRFYIPLRKKAKEKLHSWQIQNDLVPLVFSPAKEEDSHIIDPSDLKPQLLLIEDNSDVVGYLKGMLEDRYQVFVARDGEKGIEMAMEKSPDAVVSDVMMPGKNGFEVCQLLKEDEKTSHIPIVMLTARAAVEDKLKGLKHGAGACLSKPVDREE